MPGTFGRVPRVLLHCYDAFASMLITLTLIIPHVLYVPPLFYFQFRMIMDMFPEEVVTNE